MKALPPMAKKILFLVLPAVLLIVCTGCTRLFFKPGNLFVTDPATQRLSPEEVSFTSPDGVKLSGWYFKRPDARGTILVCHGNVENLSTHVKLDLWLVEAGYNLFIFDYRGYGRSEGRPDVQGVHLDAEAALETLVTRLLHPGNDRIIVFGKSLGGAIATYTVATSPYKDRVKGLIIDSAFSDYHRIAREKIADSIVGWPFQYPLSFLVNDDYSPVEKIKNISPIPVLIVCGTDDRIVPGHHGRLLYDAALEPKELWISSMPGHVKSFSDTALRQKLLNYLASLP
jgi:fermentation-respiration switch protein FrsA (DUF1100 family)